MISVGAIWVIVGDTSDWLYKVVTGHVAVGSGQIGLVAADNRTRANHRFKFRAIGTSSSGLRSSFAAEQSVIGTSYLLLLLSRRAQLPSKISLTG